MIGVFDSGSGGLTVLQAIRAQAPSADLLYVGDTLHAPYGNRSVAELERLTFEMIRFLRSHGATHLVSACNSISAAVIRPMLMQAHVQVEGITEMVGPTAAMLASARNKQICIFTTVATQRSNMYQQACADQGCSVSVIALPNLAGLIEAGAPSDALHPEIAWGINEVKTLNANMIVFGCTHFPLVRDLFEQQAANVHLSVEIFDPASVVATEAIHQHGAAGTGTTTIISTSDSPSFRQSMKKLGFHPEYHRVTRITP